MKLSTFYNKTILLIKAVIDDDGRSSLSWENEDVHEQSVYTQESGHVSKHAAIESVALM